MNDQDSSQEFGQEREQRNSEERDELFEESMKNI